MDSSPFASLTTHDASEITEHLFAAKIFSLASCVMLFYDICITFGDEVEKVWKQRFTGATVLWFMNRYLSPLGYIIIIVSFHSDWPKSVCERYVLFPEILKVFTAFAIGVIFILRLYSIYGKNTTVLAAMSLLLTLQLGVKTWAFMDGAPVELPPGLNGCILTGKSDRIVFTWIAELVFDTIVFFATLARTLIIYRGARMAHSVESGTSSNHGVVNTQTNARRQALKPSPLLRVMMRDGIIYFLVIFVANVVTVILFLTLTADLKVINASFSTLITSLMVSRLILNLRSVAYKQRSSGARGQQSTSSVLDSVSGIRSEDRGDEFHRNAKRRSSAPWAAQPEKNAAPGIIPESIIGNLGEPVKDWGEEDPPDYDADVSNYIGTHEMDEFVPAEQRSFDTSNCDGDRCPFPEGSQPPTNRTHTIRRTGTDRIIVEVTTRKDVHRDSLKPAGVSNEASEAPRENNASRICEGSSDHPVSSPHRIRSTWTAPQEWRHMETDDASDEEFGNVSETRSEDVTHDLALGRPFSSTSS